MSVTQLKPADMAPAQAKQIQKVHCPYCLLGKVALVADRKHGVLGVDMTPKQCPVCKRPFRIGFEVTFKGVQMED